ncbi:hypothetical protein RchiOBHm_Chr5g0001991 [Rosa chinensis]|uniref:Uncharacterized protein n=1 Tax=Rosa chinensis TaxID=74649 RepID=A0A2P6Q2D9_ROSCH|nr:translation initiation factor IF-2 [Rosa chinensis]PRQ28337.1 hypothetical protein RchiOBHm_Chr5g0001991 [Rosa chinensis]
MADGSRFKPYGRNCTQRSRTSTDSSSPEFEFWRLQNPSCSQPDLISADELFVDGVILPLSLVPAPKNPPDPNPRPDSEEISAPDPEPEPGPEAQVSTGALVLTVSRRWRDMFKKKSEGSEKEKEKEKKKERKSGGAATGASSAELNINLWPFSRSRSAGNACTRPKFGAPGTRKVNSAPCSRSNSTGESKSTRKWPASPGRAGVHLGRSSPVWQVRRGASTLGKTSETQVKNAEKSTKKEAPETRRGKTTASGGGRGGGGGAKPRVLNLNVPTCIGYRSHLSCRSDVMNSAVGIGGSSGGNNHRGAAAGGGGDSSNAAGAGSNLFNLRSLFSKKVY